MGHKHRSPRAKLEALTLVVSGFKQVQVGKLLNIPGQTISGWVKNETELMEKARELAPRAIRKAKRSQKARRGGLARWGKLPQPSLAEQQIGKRPKPPATSKPEKAPKSTKAFKNAPKPSRAMSEEAKQKLRDHWKRMDPDEKALRVSIMRDGSAKNSKK